MGKIPTTRKPNSKIDLDSEEHWWLLSRHDSYSDSSSSSSKIAPGINQARLSVRLLAQILQLKWLFMMTDLTLRITTENRTRLQEKNSAPRVRQSGWVSQTFSAGSKVRSLTTIRVSVGVVTADPARNEINFVKNTAKRNVRILTVPWHRVFL